MPLKTNLVEFPDLARQAFQHPLDLQAAETLKQVPGLPRVVRFMSETFSEQYIQYVNISSRLRVNSGQYPSLHRQFVRLAQVLDVRKLPSLFIETTPTINAFSMGVENYTIVLCSGLLDIMEEDELMAILGHELGHVKCEHQLFKTLAYWLSTFGDAILNQASIPGIDLVLSAGRAVFELALMDWNRKAELSSDRAALLATQDPDTVARALAKLGGFSRKYAGELNLDEAVSQCESFQDLTNESIVLKLVKLRAMGSLTHPYPVVRVKEIRSWSRSNDYASIVAGKYRRNAALAPTDGGWGHVAVETPRARECPKCSYPCAETYVFCPSCQCNVRSGPLLCSRCREPVASDWAACIGCGSWLTEERPSPPPLPGAPGAPG